MKAIRVVVIDDERSARQELKRMLAGNGDFEVIAEAASAEEAKLLIDLVAPDLIFLDIQMPGGSGFELLETLDRIPAVIFVTAYDQFALAAFEVSAMDYLLKPVRAERFEKALELARLQLSSGQVDRVFIRDGRLTHLFAWSEVWLIESMDNYARIHYRDRAALQKSSLSQLELKLAAQGFFRTSRTQLVNLDFIAIATTNAQGTITLTLQNGTTVDLSLRQSARFRALGRD